MRERERRGGGHHVELARGELGVVRQVDALVAELPPDLRGGGGARPAGSAPPRGPRAPRAAASRSETAPVPTHCERYEGGGAALGASLGDQRPTIYHVD